MNASDKPRVTSTAVYLRTRSWLYWDLRYEGPLPTHESQNYDDKYETQGYAWLLLNFGQAVAEPVRLHVAAKRYLCSVDPDYTRLLSATSLKSYFDQGGDIRGDIREGTSGGEGTSGDTQ